MIQRIQTIHLLCSAIIGIIAIILNIKNPILSFQNEEVSAFHYINLIFILISTIISIWSIFLYTNRLKQIRFVNISICFQILNYLVIILCIFTSLIQEQWGSITFYLPLISIIFNLLARKRILFDERLVRSADRLR